MFAEDAGGRARAALHFTAEQLPYDRHDAGAQQRIVAERFAGERWEIPRLMTEMRAAEDFWSDANAQVVMDTWAGDRVVLLGDAGYGPGLGTRHRPGADRRLRAGRRAGAGRGDHTAAFTAYEKAIRPFVIEHQAVACEGAEQFFMPAPTRRCWTCSPPTPRRTPARKRSASPTTHHTELRGGLAPVATETSGPVPGPADILADVTSKGAAGMAEDAPTTARLHDVLHRAGRVVIVEGPPEQTDSADLTRIVVTGAEIADLAQLLAIVDGGTGDRCRCRGWPTIMVHDVHGELIARWTLHHQSGLRGLGDSDADLRDGPALTEWLAKRGLTGSREAQSARATHEAEADRRRTRWIQAAPAGLSDAATDVAHPPGRALEAWSRRLHDAKDRLATIIRRCYPDGVTRIRVLLAWAGISSRESTGGLMWYDTAVQQLLLAEDPDLILAAITTRSASPAQLDGAAQLFACLEWTTAHGKQLPEPLRSLLIAHIQADGTDAMKFRMRHGYYGGKGIQATE